MKQLIAISLVLIMVFNAAPAHSGPVDAAIEYLPLWLPGVIIIIAIYCAYYQHSQYSDTIRLLRNSMSQYPRLSKPFIKTIIDLGMSIDAIIPDLSIFESLDKQGIKAATKKVAVDIGLDTQGSDYGDCTPEEHRSLQNMVENACGSAFACSGNDSAAILNEKIGKISQCIDARKRIMEKCYKGRNDDKHKTHKQAIDERINSIRNCQQLLSKVK